jgi:mannosyltransferase OCH1-like enzyme
MKYNHLSDALRLGTLYHFGGAYFDTDWISLRSIEKLRNVVGIEAPTFPKEDTEYFLSPSIIRQRFMFNNNYDIFLGREW